MTCEDLNTFPVAGNDCLLLLGDEVLRTCPAGIPYCQITELLKSVSFENYHLLFL